MVLGEGGPDPRAGPHAPHRIQKSPAKQPTQWPISMVPGDPRLAKGYPEFLPS